MDSVAASDPEDLILSKSPGCPYRRPGRGERRVSRPDAGHLYNNFTFGFPPVYPGLASSQLSWS